MLPNALNRKHNNMRVEVLCSRLERKWLTWHKGQLMV
ncbi:hypothetical protein Leryth_019798 [Lithospermum erythrorhizon]|nr:hypothetical protein Leryth_019798 [Lithospermum erythrorhizon]